MIITKVHPSLNELSGLSKNISDSILAKLGSTVESLEAEKQTRLEKVKLYAVKIAFFLHFWATYCFYIILESGIIKLVFMSFWTPAPLLPKKL